MQNEKEFLGTAPIGKLLFRLSVPTVVAQLINMLYNIVDRIYIGHMWGRQLGAYWCGCLYADHHACFRICGVGQCRRRTARLNLYGAARQTVGRKDIGQLFQPSACCFYGVDNGSVPME